MPAHLISSNLPLCSLPIIFTNGHLSCPDNALCPTAKWTVCRAPTSDCVCSAEDSSGGLTWASPQARVHLWVRQPRWNGERSNSLLIRLKASSPQPPVCSGFDFILVLCIFSALTSRDHFELLRQNEPRRMWRTTIWECLAEDFSLVRPSHIVQREATSRDVLFTTLPHRSVLHLMYVAICRGPLLPNFLGFRICSKFTYIRTVSCHPQGYSMYHPLSSLAMIRSPRLRSRLRFKNVSNKSG